MSWIVAWGSVVGVLWLWALREWLRGARGDVSAGGSSSRRARGAFPRHHLRRVRQEELRRIYQELHEQARRARLR